MDEVPGFKASVGRYSFTGCLSGAWWRKQLRVGVGKSRTGRGKTGIWKVKGLLLLQLLIKPGDQMAKLKCRGWTLPQSP